jgi:hypothetical protein
MPFLPKENFELDRITKSRHCAGCVYTVLAALLSADGVAGTA